MHLTRRARAAAVVATALWPVVPGLAGCTEDDAAHAQEAIRQEHLPRVRQILEEDFARHREGVRKAASRLAAGFAVEDATVRERQMRTALAQVQNPAAAAKIRIAEFIASPMSFLAAVGKDGVVIARDIEPDRMRGAEFGKRYAVVRQALAQGEEGYALGEFEAGEGERPSISMLFVAPARRDGQTVGAVVAGIPLWRMAQRLSRQLRVDHAGELEKGLVLWVYLTKGDRLFHFGTPPEVDGIVPDAAARRRGLDESPKGFTGKATLHARTYGYGLFPVPSIGEDVRVVLMRADPPD